MSSSDELIKVMLMAKCLENGRRGEQKTTLECMKNGKPCTPEETAEIIARMEHVADKLDEAVEKMDAASKKTEPGFRQKK